MATDRSLVVVLGAMTGVLLALASCTAQHAAVARTHESSPPALSTPFHGAPALPAKDTPGPSATVTREASGITWLVQQGDEYLNKADSAIVILDTHDLQLTAGVKEFSWAVYGFSQPGPSFTPALVHVRFSGTPPAALWLGAADYQQQHWDWHLLNPANDSVELEFPASGAWVNAAGGSFFALGVWDGGAAAIHSCSVQGAQDDPEPPAGWPMFGHDVRHSHQSQYTGPQDALLQWVYETDQPIKTGPVMSADGIVYFSCDSGYLYALNPQGTLRWRYDLGGKPASCPALDASGNVYCGKWGGAVLALDPDGTLLWSADAAPSLSGVSSNITITDDGTLYYCSGDLVALDLSGNLKWTCASGGGGNAGYTPAVGPSGAVYFSDGDVIVAANPDGSVNWSEYYYLEDHSFHDACLGVDETLFVTTYDGMWHDQSVMLRDMLGDLKWFYTTDTHSAAAIASDGTLYLNDIELEAIDTAGATKWTYSGVSSDYSSPAIGADGTVYACSDVDGSTGIYAIDSAGVLKWSYSAAETYASSPAIGPNGALYVGSDLGNLYAFGVTPPEWLLPPVSVSASDGSLPGQVRITWQAPASGPAPETYYIYRSLNRRSGYTELANVPASELQYDDLTAESDRIYYYKLASYSAADGYSCYSLVDSGYAGGLGLSDWPVYGQNAQRTGLSAYPGTQNPNVVWSHCVSGSYGATGPVLAGDGTAYVYECGGECIYAINPDGSEKWHYHVGYSMLPDPRGAPGVGPDGTIYWGGYHNIYALNPDGSLKWCLPVAARFISSPAFDAGGTIYIGEFALNPDGSVKWAYEADGEHYSNPALADDGTVYVASSDGKLRALNPDGSLKWEYAGDVSPSADPVVGNNGAIYIKSAIDSANTRLTAVNPDGSWKWDYDLAIASDISNSVAIAADDTVYLGGYDEASNQGAMYAVAPDGTLTWQHNYDSGALDCSPVIGSDGVVYIGVNVASGNDLLALNPDGTLLFSLDTGASGGILAGLALDAAGALYASSCDSYVVKIGP